jgi:hypothetical protein
MAPPKFPELLEPPEAAGNPMGAPEQKILRGSQSINQERQRRLELTLKRLAIS